MPLASTHRRNRAALRLQIERQGGLPVRPASARALLLEPRADSVVDVEAGLPASGGLRPPRPNRFPLDPGWTLAALAGDVEPLALVEGRPWWPGGLSRQVHEARETLWRHAVATRRAAERLALEAKYADPQRLADTAFLAQLGLWAVAAMSPENLAGLLAIGDAARRREAERSLLGIDAAALGRELAEAWRLPELLVEAAWLHADTAGDWSGATHDPVGLELIQQARLWAERTPWALDRPRGAPLSTLEPSGERDTVHRTRQLVAEVQALCAGGLCPADATGFEERLARSHAALQRRHERLQQGCAARDHTFAQIADLASGLGSDSEAETEADVPTRPTPIEDLAGAEARRALEAVTESRDRRQRQASRLDAMTEAYRRHVAQEDSQRRIERLEALAEFAAGAAHELNNPLAVIMGRAQLLMTRRTEDDSLRSLRAIVGQAQRAHRILRDLIYVARPAEPRPRPCHPDAVARACLDDLRAEADARSIRLVARISEPLALTSADMDALRHLAEVLLRNALEATRPGGSITLIARSRPDRLDWTVRDQGAGLDPQASRHLLDPFYCGREAGRGLGLGLSRAARYVTRAGGRLRWRSVPGRGTTFRVTMPLPEVAMGQPHPGLDRQNPGPGNNPISRPVPLAG